MDRLGIITAEVEEEERRFTWRVEPRARVDRNVAE